MTDDLLASSPSMSIGPYVLITPAKDEAAFIGETLRSVAAQTVLPLEWIIISDGSTDGTDAIIRAAQKLHPWIRLIQLPPRPQRCFGTVARIVKLAVGELSESNYAFLGLLDSDLSVPADYFEKLIAHFQTDPALGLAGGRVLDPGEDLKMIPDNLLDVYGAVQFFRRDCFESLSDIHAIPEGGWDTLTCVEARMNGFKTLMITSLVVRHLKPTNAAMGSMAVRRWQNGERDYALGYHPLFEIVKCARRIRQRPFLLSTVCWYAGYLYSVLKRRKRCVPARIMDHLRKEQLTRLRSQLLPKSRLRTPKICPIAVK